MSASASADTPVMVIAGAHRDLEQAQLSVGASSSLQSVVPQAQLSVGASSSLQSVVPQAEEGERDDDPSVVAVSSGGSSSSTSSGAGRSNRLQDRIHPLSNMFSQRPFGDLCAKAAVAAACFVEAAVAVPTLHVEHMIMTAPTDGLKQQGPWAFLLRLTVSAFRLIPVIMLVGSCLWRTSCGSSERCRNCLRPSLREKLVGLLQVTFSFLLFPEVRWGLTITLDMWYLLSTPLNEGMNEMSFGVLLVANVSLCFLDTLTLILLLAFKSSEEPEFFTESETFHRPRPIKLGHSTNDIEHTCTICLSEFEEEDEAVQLPCNHVFHTECVGRWLQRSRHCPMRCPQLVLPPMMPHAHASQSSIRGAGSDAPVRFEPVLIGQVSGPPG